jgi:SAM-dependent methyltransferase
LIARRGLLGPIFLGMAAAAVARPQQDWDKWDVPFVASHDEVILAMLRLAKVTPRDVVYDLGCGDGRIVILAAKRFGARGVGIDIDPERIKEANRNAAAEGVADRVRFVERDLFQADIGEATVVALYLLTSVNERLRPKLLRDLAPGTRIVSHQFGMGDWKPLRTTRARGRRVLLWVVGRGATATP